MCLITVYNGKKKKAELAKLPDMVKCWKVVRRRTNKRFYWPPIFDNDAYKVGWNVVNPISCCVGYRVAYHAFLNKKDAIGWMNTQPDQLVVQSKTEKEDIIAIGRQDDNLCIVTKRTWIPKPKKQA